MLKLVFLSTLLALGAANPDAESDKISQFLSALDAVWMLTRFHRSGRTADTRAALAKRAELLEKLRQLSAFTKEQLLKPEFQTYSLAPGSRYRARAAHRGPRRHDLRLHNAAAAVGECGLSERRLHPPVALSSD